MNPRLRLPARTARLRGGESDERLAELARGGSTAAFDALIARHRGALVSDCARLLGAADAEEAVQEALIRAHMRLAAGHAVHAPGPWLRVIARHTALNMLRAQAVRPPVSEHDLELVPTPGDAPEQRRRLSELVEAVAALPERQRHAIVMRELEGRSYEEIGRRLDASDGAVRQLLSRARSSLRLRLGALAGLEPLVRLALGGGGGMSAARLGALSGGCVLSVKLGAVVLFPALAVGPRTAHPSHLRAFARAQGVKRTAVAPGTRDSVAVTVAFRRRAGPAPVPALAAITRMAVPIPGARARPSVPSPTRPLPVRRARLSSVGRSRRGRWASTTAATTTRSPDFSSTRQ